MSSFTQISLDFGPEQQVPPSVPADGRGIDEGAKPYMSAGGVGVRIKSYKQTASPAGATGDLFGPAAAPPEQEQVEAEEEPGTAAVPADMAEPAGVVEMPIASAEMEARATAPAEPAEPANEKQRVRATARPAAGGKRASN